jgi:beta-lactamase class A
MDHTTTVIVGASTMPLSRRQTLALLASTPLASTLSPAAAAQTASSPNAQDLLRNPFEAAEKYATTDFDPAQSDILPKRDLEVPLREFKAFPGTKSFRIDIGNNTVASHAAATQLFVASAIKTFILCRYLRDVEVGRLSEDEQLAVNNSVRTSASPVLLNLKGTTPARSILEAMITHSDNTATDIALLRVDPNRVRSFIAAAGLDATLIPDSTRLFFSHNVGAPIGVDIGWAGVQRVLESGHSLGPPRPPLNKRVTLASSAADLVSFYKRALRGGFFTKRTTLAEFKRIHLTNSFFPTDTVGYAKGGSADLLAHSLTDPDFHALSYAGQMVVGATPVTFCFVVNWMSKDPNSTSDALTPAFADVINGCLVAIKQQLLA